MKKTNLGIFIATITVLALSGQAVAAPAFLALRLGNQATCSMNATTKQVVASAFGTTLCSLPFTGTATYHFYSPPLAAAVNLMTTDKGGGVVFMRNTSTSAANDFAVSGRMQYYDYNPATDAEVLIVDTTASPPKNVNHGQTVNWAIPNVALPAGVTFPAGHLLHVAVTIGQVAGNPGSCGQFLFDGPAGSSTAALFPQNNNAITWNYSPTLSLAALPDKTVALTCLGNPGTNYVIEACTNLVGSCWAPVCTNQTGGDGLISYVDVTATNYPCRFFRVGPAD